MQGRKHSLDEVRTWYLKGLARPPAGCEPAPIRPSDLESVRRRFSVITSVVRASQSADPAPRARSKAAAAMEAAPTTISSAASAGATASRAGQSPEDGSVPRFLTLPGLTARWCYRRGQHDVRLTSTAPTDEMVRAIRQDAISLALAKHGDLAVILLRLGTLDWLISPIAVFDERVPSGAALSPAKLSPPQLPLVSIVLCAGNDQSVLAERTTVLPARFAEHLRAAMMHQATALTGGRAERSRIDALCRDAAAWPRLYAEANHRTTLVASPASGLDYRRLIVLPLASGATCWVARFDDDSPESSWEIDGDTAGFRHGTETVGVRAVAGQALADAAREAIYALDALATQMAGEGILTNRDEQRPLLTALAWLARYGCAAEAESLAALAAVGRRRSSLSPELARPPAPASPPSWSALATDVAMMLDGDHDRLHALRSLADEVCWLLLLGEALQAARSTRASVWGRIALTPTRDKQVRAEAIWEEVSLCAAAVAPKERAGAVPARLAAWVDHVTLSAGPGIPPPFLAGAPLALTESRTALADEALASLATGLLSRAPRARPRLVDRPLSVVLPRDLLPPPLGDLTGFVVQPTARPDGLGLWVRIERLGRPAAVGWWAANPASARRAWIRARDIWPWLHALLAALWSDLSRDPVAIEGAAARAWLARMGEPTRGRPGALLLPGQIDAETSALLLWPDDEERERLWRSATVPHFYRRLPDGWESRVGDPAWQRRQEEARERAWAYGCDLPENAGLTFVKDFVRGQQHGSGTAPRPVRSAGLLRLAVTLRQLEMPARP
jgi:hypothetical protein